MGKVWSEYIGVKARRRPESNMVPATSMLTLADTYTRVVGSSQIDLILRFVLGGFRWRDGQVVTLHFTDSLTLKNNATAYEDFAPIVTASGADTVVAAGAMVDLVFDDSVPCWRQRGGSGGTQGPAGAQGVQGPAGNDGATGPQGIQGPAGGDSAVPGPQGAQGAQGPQGPAGADSIVPGPQGPQGIQGVPGNAGTPGNPGAAGSDGAAGPQGAQGPPGNNGVQGIQGVPGNDGAAGGQGIQGVQGVQGIPGPGTFEAGGDVGVAATPATTGVMTVVMDTAVKTIAPTGACTFNASGGVAGQLCTFSITTVGTTSRVLTWGTNFRKTATLATGTTAARFFAVTFRCLDGVIWQEVARTAVQT